jgi:hypothetical protein
LPNCRSIIGTLARWCDGKGVRMGASRGRLRFPRRVCLPANLLLALSAVAATVTPAPAVHEVDWRTSPLDLNLRGLNGERFRFHCPSGKARSGQVIGSGPYTDGSSICAAGAHAGVIKAASGGVVTIELRPGQAHYEASWNHFIRSESYEGFWSGSFLIIAPNSLDGPPPAVPGR